MTGIMVVAGRGAIDLPTGTRQVGSSSGHNRLSVLGELNVPGRKNR